MPRGGKRRGDSKAEAPSERPKTYAQLMVVGFSS